jgi:integrase
LSAITVADVDAFIESKSKKGWTRASLAALASSLRSFFAFAEARGWCPSGITAVIESPRLYTREGIPEGPGWDDVQRLLVATSGDRPADIRDHAILMLLAVYGLRRGEVAALRLDDLDWEGELDPHCATQATSCSTLSFAARRGRGNLALPARSATALRASGAVLDARRTHSSAVGAEHHADCARPFEPPRPHPVPRAERTAYATPVPATSSRRAFP